MTLSTGELERPLTYADKGPKMKQASRYELPVIYQDVLSRVFHHPKSQDIKLHVILRANEREFNWLYARK